MRPIKAHLETGFAGCTRRVVLEVDDDATVDDIEEAVREWALNSVSWGWSEA